MHGGFMIKNTAFRLRGRLKLFTALTVAGSIGAAAVALAQTATEPVVVPGNGTTSDLSTYQIQEVKIKYKKLLLREKDIPNAVTVLGSKQVQAANPTFGSIQTLLLQAPSVVAYSQQPGQNNVTLAIRGVANNQLAETLDGVPINDLLNGTTGNYLSDSSIGSPVTLNEIDGVTLYPGLAPPAKQGFGTTGGTIAYMSKQPTDERYEELEGGFGSFDTQHVGFVINTGKMYDDIDAPKALLLYDQSQTAGYVTNTQSQFHDFEFNIIKPYNSGLSHVGLLILFNQGKGYVQTLPAPVALINAVGYKFNYPKSLAYFNQADKDLTTILSDQTYINQYAIFNASLFFLHNNTNIINYASPEAIDNGYPYNGVTYTPNVQGIDNFFGCVGSSAANGVVNPQMTYDPAATFGSCAAGESDNTIHSHSNEVGVTPSLTLFPDEHNTVVIGGLIAKTTGETTQYVYGGEGSNIPEINGYNALQFGGGQQRTIYSAYAQDTVRLLDDKLQIIPGVKVDAAYSSNIKNFQDGFPTVNYPYEQKLSNYTKIGGYYLGAAYNLPANFVLYGSLGKGSLFAPVGDYSEGTTVAGAPTGSTNTLSPEIVHLYEGGLRYDTPRLLLNVDYYYENVSDAFAFFQNFLTNAEYYGNNGGELYRGVEGNGDFRITPELSIFGNFSYNEAIYTKSFFALDTLAQDQFGFAFTGTPLSNVPIWNGLVGADYESGPYSIYATGQYTGREYTTEDLNAPPYGNTPGIPANPLNAATVTNQNILNPANFVVNLLLSYKIPLPPCAVKTLTASLNLQNIFNERYYTYTYSSQNPVEGIYDPNLPGGQPYNSGFVGQPRSVLLDLVAKF